MIAKPLIGGVTLVMFCIYKHRYRQAFANSRWAGHSLRIVAKLSLKVAKLAR